MAENVDVKAGIKHILERIETASKNRPVQVRFHKMFPDFYYNFYDIFSSKMKFNLSQLAKLNLLNY